VPQEPVALRDITSISSALACGRAGAWQPCLRRCMYTYFLRTYERNHAGQAQALEDRHTLAPS
jgi:hypothetical protein